MTLASQHRPRCAAGKRWGSFVGIRDPHSLWNGVGIISARVQKSHATPTMTTTLPPLTEVLDLMPDAVCVVDPEGRLLFVNASFQRIFGYAPEEVLGRQIFSLVHP